MATSKLNLVGKKLTFQSQEFEETPIMIKWKKTAPKNTVVKLLGKNKIKQSEKKTHRYLKSDEKQLLTVQLI